MKGLVMKIVRRFSIITLSLIFLSGLFNGAIEKRAAAQSDATEGTVRLDTERAVTQLITPEGGIIDATAADGTMYRLTLPPGALLSEEEITLTPVIAVEGPPLSGGLAGGVQISPEDLVFWKLARLEMKPTSPPTPQQEIPFGWSNQGEDLHLQPLLLPSQLRSTENSEITPQEEITPQDLFGGVFNVASGGGLGLGKDAGADLLRWRQQTPCQVRSQLEQQLQQELSAERQRQLNGDPPDPNALTNAINVVNRFYKTALKQQIKRALKSKDEASQRCALMNALSTLQQLEVLGATDGIYSTLKQQTSSLMEKAVKTGFDNAKAKCDVVKMLEAERQAQLFGFSVAGDISSLPQECNFVLSFDSQAVFVGRDQGVSTVTVRVNSEVPIKYQRGVYQFLESAPLRHQVVKWEQVGCDTAYGSYSDSVLRISGVDPDLNLRVDSSCKSGQECKVKPPKFRISFNPGIPKESFTLHCKDYDDEVEASPVWLGGFGYLHINDVNGKGDFELRGFVLDVSSESPVLARRQYRQTVNWSGPRGSASLTENTSIELRRR